MIRYVETRHSQAKQPQHSYRSDSGEKKHVNDLILNSQMMMWLLLSGKMNQTILSSFFFLNTTLMPEGFHVFSSVCCLFACCCVKRCYCDLSQIVPWAAGPPCLHFTHTHTRTRCTTEAPRYLCMCFSSVIVRWLLPWEDHRAGSEAAGSDDSSTHFPVTLAI